MRCSYYPQSLVRICGAIGRSGVGFGGVDPRVLFIPSCPDVTGLTGALDRSDRCKPFVEFGLVICLIRLSLGCAVAGQFLAGLVLFC
jgi:hypothetical protein